MVLGILAVVSATHLADREAHLANREAHLGQVMGLAD